MNKKFKRALSSMLAFIMLCTSFVVMNVNTALAGVETYYDISSWIQAAVDAEVTTYEESNDRYVLPASGVFTYNGLSVLTGATNSRLYLNEENVFTYDKDADITINGTTYSTGDEITTKGRIYFNGSSYFDKGEAKNRRLVYIDAEADQYITIFAKNTGSSAAEGALYSVAAAEQVETITVDAAGLGILQYKVTADDEGTFYYGNVTNKADVCGILVSNSSPSITSDFNISVYDEVATTTAVEAFVVTDSEGEEVEANIDGTYTLTSDNFYTVSAENYVSKTFLSRGTDETIYLTPIYSISVSGPESFTIVDADGEEVEGVEGVYPLIYGATYTVTAPGYSSADVTIESDAAIDLNDYITSQVDVALTITDGTSTISEFAVYDSEDAEIVASEGVYTLVPGYIYTVKADGYVWKEFSVQSTDTAVEVAVDKLVRYEYLPVNGDNSYSLASTSDTGLFGTNDFFTARGDITVAGGVKYNEGLADEIVFEGRVKTNGPTNSSRRYIGFTVDTPADVEVYFVSGSGGSLRDAQLFNSGFSVIASESNDSTSACAKLAYTIADPGTYYVGGGANIGIAGIFVTPKSGDASTEYAKSWDFLSFENGAAISFEDGIFEATNLTGNKSTYAIGNAGASAKINMETIPEGYFGAVKASYCYKANIDFDGEATASTNSGSTSTVESATYFYDALTADNEGYITVNALGQTYFTAFQRVAVKAATVSGTVTNTTDETVSDAAVITFTNKETGNVFSAPYGSEYSISVPVGYTYIVELENSDGLTTTAATSEVVVDEEAETFNVEITELTASTVSGSVYDLDSDAEISISFNDTEVEIVDGSYSVELLPGTYTVAVTEVDGYSASALTLTDLVVVKGQDATRNILYIADTVDSVEYADTIYVGSTRDYKTVNAAIDAISKMSRGASDRVVVSIDAGTYREQVIVDQPNVTLKSTSGENDVTITWYYGIGYEYYSCDPNGYYSRDYEVSKQTKNACTTAIWGSACYVTGKNFLAENINFENSFNLYVTDEEIADGVESAGSMPERTATSDVSASAYKERANAFAFSADNVECYQCSFKSYQDTLGYNGGKDTNAYFKECDIYGTTDYICGAGAIIFDACNLIWTNHSDKDAGGYITAAKATAAVGYLFRDCVISQEDTANSGYAITTGYFGRPWDAAAKVIFANTVIESGAIVGEGWASMSGNTPENANFYEYNNTVNEAAFTSTKGKTLSDAEYEAILDSDYLGDWIPFHHPDYVEPEEDTGIITATWDFQNGIPSSITSVNIQKTTGTVASDVEGIELYVDATTGKLQARSSDAQFNAGAVIQVPVMYAGDTVTVVSYPGYHNYTVAGVAADADTVVYTATADDAANGYVEIVATANSYLYNIVLVSVDPTVIVDATWDFQNSIPSSITSVAIQGTTGTVASDVEGVELYVDATTGKLQYNTAGYAQFNKDTVIQVPVNSEGDTVTVVSYPGQYKYTVGGVAAEANETVYTATAEDAEAGYVAIIATGGAYLYSIALHSEYIPGEEIEEATAENYLVYVGKQVAQGEVSFDIRLVGYLTNDEIADIDEVGYLATTAADYDLASFDAIKEGNEGTAVAASEVASANGLTSFAITKAYSTIMVDGEAKSVSDVVEGCENKYFATFKINGIPTGTNATLSVLPYTVVEGNIYFGEAAAVAVAE